MNSTGMIASVNGQASEFYRTKHKVRLLKKLISTFKNKQLDPEPVFKSLSNARGMRSRMFEALRSSLENTSVCYLESAAGKNPNALLTVGSPTPIPESKITYIEVLEGERCIASISFNLEAIGKNKITVSDADGKEKSFRITSIRGALHHIGKQVQDYVPVEPYLPVFGAHA